MKIVEDIQQNTPDWLNYRRTHIGSSDSGVIMHPGPYKTRTALWQEKVLGWEQSHDEASLARMAEGTRLEPEAREAFQTIVGVEVNPLVVQHDFYPFLSASLDGISSDFQTCVEIKCGKKAFVLAQMGEISPQYYAQVSHQLLITGLQFIYFFCYWEEDSILMKIDRNDVYIQDLLEKEKWFWQCVRTSTPPEEHYATTRAVS
jgi:putative phage-type endonuclease